ncbi:MAG: class I SAM-dependent methyltransferase [Mycobacterium sp.]|nr:class I SAM-dependent methyltransferase [Mycobacterium sp.]
MSRRLLIDALYRLGRPPWDTPPPEELRQAIEGPGALRPGHALDVGCGTGTNVIYMAMNGWQATGVDFSAAAISTARRRAEGIPGARFIRGDATKLTEIGIAGPIDLALDMGTFHSLPDTDKPVYVRELAALLTPGTPLVMWQGIRIKPGEIPDAFGAEFTVESITPKDFVIRRAFLRKTIPGQWYRLRRR